MEIDPFAEIKRQVLDRLRRLYPTPSGSRPEVEQQVRQVLHEVLVAGEMPLAAADRVRVAREVCEIIGV